MKIKIPFKTPTINHLYWHKGNIKILTKEARELKKKIYELVPTNNIEVGTKLKVEVEIYENWLTKKGEVKKKDISNREKFLIDSIFDALGIDDKFIFEQKMKKVQSDQEFAIILIKQMGVKMSEEENEKPEEPKESEESK
jgi:hypothetical protein